MSKVYIWYPHRDPAMKVWSNLKKSWCVGHASMHIGKYEGMTGHKGYVSWWDVKDSGGLFTSATGKRQTLAADIASEGVPPHVTYTLYDNDDDGNQLLDIEAMRQEWRTIRNKETTAHYRTLAKNCSTIVGRVLRAGGVEGLLSKIQTASYAHNMYWTPKDVAQLCDLLVKKGYATKSNSGDKPSKFRRPTTLIGLR
jgi:hypothetical protein